jgi:hypothetical protein
MDVDNLVYNDIISKLATARERLYNAKKANSVIDVLKSKERKFSLMLDNVKELCSALELLYTAATEESVSFRSSRIDYLEWAITDQLAEVFPQDLLRAEIDRDFSRGQSKLELSLIDRWGEKRDPYVTEGMLAQQLLNYVSARTITRLLGFNRMFLDEAFSQSDDNNLSKISEVLNTDQNDGVQIVLVEHKSQVYKDIPHREIVFSKDASTLSTTVEVLDL